MKEFTVTRTVTIDFRSLEGTDFHVICYHSTENKTKSYAIVDTKQRKKIESAKKFNKTLLNDYKITPSFIQDLLDSDSKSGFSVKNFVASPRVVSKNILGMPKRFGHIYFCGDDGKDGHIQAKTVYKNGIPETHELVLFNSSLGLFYNLDGVPLKFNVLEQICMDDYYVQSYMDAVHDGRIGRLPAERFSEYFEAVFPMTDELFMEYIKGCVTGHEYTNMANLRKKFGVELVESPYSRMNQY